MLSRLGLTAADRVMCVLPFSYVYGLSLLHTHIAVGGSRGSFWFSTRSSYIAMLTSGLWHGASWNFVLWGAFQGALLVLQRLAAPLWPARAPAAAGGPALRLLAILAMFHLTCFGWLIFLGLVAGGAWVALKPLV